MVGMRDVNTSVTGNAMPMITTIFAYSADNDELSASLQNKGNKKCSHTNSPYLYRIVPQVASTVTN